MPTAAPAGVSAADAAPLLVDSGPVGALLIHGLTGTPASMTPWGHALADAGLSVRVPLLPGHGTRWQDANTVHWQDWYTAVEAAFDSLSTRCTSVFVMGLSMGGTLALRLAEQRGDALAGVVVVNPSLFTERKDAKLLPVLRLVVASRPPIRSDIAADGVVEPAYDRLPVKAMYQLSQLWKVTNADLPRITAPLLVATSRQDHVVEPANSARLMERAGSTDKRQLWLERSYHVATLDHDADLITRESLAFVDAHAARG